MHPAAIITINRLGHEGYALAILIGDILDHIFIEHHVVSRTHQRIEFQINFGLSASGYLVMVALHLQAAVLHGHDHLAAQILIVVRWRHREIAFFVARPISLVVFDSPRIPTSFFSVDEVKPMLFTLIKTHVIEDKELRLGSEISRIRQTGRAQIHFRFLRDVARVTVVALLGDRIHHIAYHNQRGHFGERIQHVSAGVRHEQHVALMNRRPAANRRAVHAESFLK